MLYLFVDEPFETVAGRAGIGGLLLSPFGFEIVRFDKDG
jgi:hypothetical protein